MHALHEPAGAHPAGAAHNAAGQRLALAGCLHPGGAVKTFLEGILAGLALFGPATIVYLLKGI